MLRASVDTVVPLSEPIKTAKGEIKELFIPKGTDVRISVTGMNRSSALWGPNSKEFDMDRWSNPITERATKIPGIYSSMLSFSGGPSACLGWRFALLELSEFETANLYSNTYSSMAVEVVLAILLQNFIFQPTGTARDSVKWMTTALRFPVIEGEEASGPQLLLKVIPRR